MKLNYRFLARYVECPYAYLLWTTKHIKGIMERGRDIRRVIKVYHDRKNADRRLEAAIDFLVDLCSRIQDPQVLGMYQKMFEWLQIYDRFQHDNPAQFRPKARRLAYAVDGLSISMTVDLVEPLGQGVAAWVLSSLETPPEQGQWEASFEGQLAMTIVKAQMTEASELKMYNLRTGTLLRVDLLNWNCRPEFDAELRDAVRRYIDADRFPMNEGDHCISCFHYRNGCSPFESVRGQRTRA